MGDRFGKEILYCEVCGEPLEKMIPGGPVLGMDLILFNGGVM